MRLISSMLALLVAMLVCLLPAASLGEAIDLEALTPIEMTAEAEGQVLDLYCGPTQGFYRHGDQMLDTGKPYVLFGQYDCWAMAAQGTKDDFGPVGWVEAGSITDIPYEPQLAFEDGFAAMIEETAPLTGNPLSENPFEGWTAALEAGTQVTVLAQMGDWLYIQTEIEGIPARVFIPVHTIF
ncbi:MAG: hypothetical protein IKJ11_10315 [Clostridia bacterium]|nr:hypothetical protein [Clostridia bacterium]